MVIESKPIIKSNTMQFAAAVSILGVIEMNFSLLQNLLGEYYGLSYVVLSVGIAVLRMKTSKAIA